MPCLGAYKPSGIRTHDRLITIREHEPLPHSVWMSFMLRKLWIRRLDYVWIIYRGQEADVHDLLQFA